MEIIALAGWLLAIIFGAGWWIEHRGIAGIKRDLEDAQREIRNRTTRK